MVNQGPLPCQPDRSCRKQPPTTYPPELIARWCGVSLRTAYLYKIGSRKSSQHSYRRLHGD